MTNSDSHRPPVPSGWTERLADAVAEAVREFARHGAGETVALLAVDCHPWNGQIGLSALTAAEAKGDPLLADPAEMAAWRHHDFAAKMAAWQPVAGLGREMSALYESGERPAVAVAFLRACADAVASVPVGAALEVLPRAEGFRVSVAHPDDGREFVPMSPLAG